MEPARIWKENERVEITYLGRSVVGVVKMATPDGGALELSFDALLGGYAGRMFVLWRPQLKGYRCSIMEIEVKLAEPYAGVSALMPGQAHG